MGYSLHVMGNVNKRRVILELGMRRRLTVEAA